MQEIIMALLNPNEMLGKPCGFFFSLKYPFRCLHFLFQLYEKMYWNTNRRLEDIGKNSGRSKRNRTGSGFFSLFSMMTLLVLHPEVKSNWLTLRFSVDILDILQNILCWHSTSDIIQSCPNTLFLWWQSVCLFGSCGLCYFWKAFQRHLLSFHSRS